MNIIPALVIAVQRSCQRWRWFPQMWLIAMTAPTFLPNRLVWNTAHRGSALAAVRGAEWAKRLSSNLRLSPWRPLHSAPGSTNVLLRPSYAKIWARSDAWNIGPWRTGTYLKNRRHFQRFLPWRPPYRPLCRVVEIHWGISVTGKSKVAHIDSKLFKWTNL